MLSGAKNLDERHHPPSKIRRSVQHESAAAGTRSGRKRPAAPSSEKTDSFDE